MRNRVDEFAWVSPDCIFFSYFYHR